MFELVFRIWLLPQTNYLTEKGLHITDKSGHGRPPSILYMFSLTTCSEQLHFLTNCSPPSSSHIKIHRWSNIKIGPWNNPLVHLLCSWNTCSQPLTLLFIPKHPCDPTWLVQVVLVHTILSLSMKWWNSWKALRTANVLVLDAHKLKAQSLMLLSLSSHL